METNVLVVGLGLIGGSISLSIKKQQNCSIVGYDVNEQRMKLASSLSVIDSYTHDLQGAAENADVIILSAPVAETINLIKEISSFELKEGTLITDVGSTKKEIVLAADTELPKHVSFVGGHPMAGSHKSGVEAAREDLFENAFFVLTPGKDTSYDAIERTKWLLKHTRAKFIEMDAEEHDQVAGVISHFPHIIASSLVMHAEHYHKESPIIQDLAAGGFKDITRIASSNPKMWTDILMHNRKPLLQQFDFWMDQMKEIRGILNQASYDSIYSFFHQSKKFRDEFSTHKRGGLATYVDLFIDIPDSPGVLAEITTLLAEHQINITNIEIIESREDIYGVLRVSFLNDADRMEANDLLKGRYKTFIIS